MDVVGNDIVWLGDPANVGRHSDAKLLQRILNPLERLLVATAADPEFLLWSLWAAKEAAYKAWAQESGDFLFSPGAMSVEFLPGEGVARVVNGPRALPVRWVRGPDWVHAVAAEDAGSVVVRSERSEGDPSTAVRDLAVRALAEAGGPQAGVQGRPPRFLAGEADLGVPVSLSHDGPYIAVAFRWRN